MTTPWLIQRCNFSPEGKLIYQYMGSAEFEFGGPQDSMKRILANSFKSQTGKLKLGDEHFNVYLIASSDFDFDYYLKEYMPLLTDNQMKSRLKEKSYFLENIHKSLGLPGNFFQATDVWFDIENDVFFCLSPAMNDKMIAKLYEIKTKWKK